MDVGFNNTNKLHIALENPFLEDVEWLIEATSTERHDIWNRYHKKHEWEEVSHVEGYTILELEVEVKAHPMVVGWPFIKKEKLPIYISFNYAIVDGHKILFYECKSLLAHHGYVEAFFKTYFQRTHDGYSRWNHTDAMNAHNCFGYFYTLDKEPRDTKYKPDNSYFIFKEL